MGNLDIVRAWKGKYKVAFTPKNKYTDTFLQKIYIRSIDTLEDIETIKKKKKNQVQGDVKDILLTIFTSTFKLLKI